MLHDRKPFTYLIVEKTSGKTYYGVRFAKGCNPSDLGKTYFSSCKRLKDSFKSNPSDYHFEVRKTFTDIDKAKDWEHKVLRRLNAVKSPKWINSANGRPSSGKPGPKSPEHAEKLRFNAEKARAAAITPGARKRRSDRMIGKIAPNKGLMKYDNLLTKDFLKSTIHLSAGKLSREINISPTAIFKYRKECLGYTTIQGNNNVSKQLRGPEEEQEIIVR